MPRPRHTNKEVEAAVHDAEDRGWTLRIQGHWGRLYCPEHNRDGCQVGVYGTPRNPENHARGIRRAVERCPHATEDTDDVEPDEESGPADV